MTWDAVARAVFDVGRVGLASLFVLGGANKIVDPAPSLLRMEQAGLPWPGILIVGVIAVELGLGLLVAMGRTVGSGRLVPAAAAVLLMHTAAINVLLHPFWSLNGVEAAVELSLFFKNVAVMGGLAMVAALYWQQTTAGNPRLAINVM